MGYKSIPIDLLRESLNLPWPLVCVKFQTDSRSKPQIKNQKKRHYSKLEGTNYFKGPSLTSVNLKRNLQAKDPSIPLKSLIGAVDETLSVSTLSTPSPFPVSLELWKTNQGIKPFSKGLGVVKKYFGLISEVRRKSRRHFVPIFVNITSGRPFNTVLRSTYINRYR